MTAPISPPRSASAGYSLVEMIAVLVLIGIGAALAVPRMGGMIDNSKTSGAIGQLSSDLAYARILAVRWGRPTSVRFSASGAEYTVTVDTAGTASPDFHTVKTVRVAGDYAGVLLAVPRSQVSFTPRGLPYSESHGTFKAVKGSTVDSLFLYPTGRVYRDK